MSSTHEPVHLLEPSNLLEPLDLTDNESRDSVRPPADHLGEKIDGGDQRVDMPLRRYSRSSFKSALIVAGALACFGAGTALQLPAVIFGDIKPLQPVGATHPSASTADGQAKSDGSQRVEGRSNETTSNGSNQSAALDANATARPAMSEPNQNASAADQSVPAANDTVGGGAVASDRQTCPNSDANCFEGDVANPTGATRIVRKSDGSLHLSWRDPPPPKTTGALAAKRSASAKPVPQPAIPQSANLERADTRVAGRQEERVQSSRRSRREARRDTTEQPAFAKRNLPITSSSGRRPDPDANRTSNRRRDEAADDNVPTVNFSSRRQDSEGTSNWRWGDDVPTTASSGQRQHADANRTSNWGRDQAADESVPTVKSRGRRQAGANRTSDENVPTASPSSRRRDTEAIGTPNWHRDRYDEYKPGDNRRVRRTPREDDPMIARAQRDERPMMMFDFR
jgi:hypothetical protein